MGVALAAWWGLVGRAEGMASVALLAPWASGQPYAGAQLAGFTLDPLAALATGGFTYLMGTIMGCVVGAGFAAEQATPAVLAALASPATWLCAGGAACASWLSSIVAMRGTVASGIVGQVLGAGALVAATWLRARVENGGIWGVDELAACAVAVTCLLFMCILTVLRGPLFLGQEGEDSDELP